MNFIFFNSVWSVRVMKTKKDRKKCNFAPGLCGNIGPVPFLGEKALPSRSHWREQEEAVPDPGPHAKTQLKRFPVPSQ